ncbi:Amino acid ABC transporter, periplasmic amino acid-binding protein [Psychrobacter aquaticus CMS 56]|uniref:Amino acid ABC transporter, periplasmic amino acid-binding protein n=2 Tax=Psychrobacter TaxID=497 RepID=U4T2Y2_9GAMM|nr:transporter substrate-binding domain-containing protein [Psychrobacter aquaticus]ERL55452.1 Amino acid ABC transporter, periplasmic amino acid-binding protein [Psychrobacter aquaticus CMS 56]
MNKPFDQYRAIANNSVSNEAKVRRFSVPVMAMSMLLALVGCSNGQNETNVAATQDEVATGEVLRIATEGAYAPFNYTNADGTLGGFDVEIANALCADMKVTCDISAQDWDGIIPGLKAGKYDAIVAAMSVTPEREQQVSFTEPYFSNTLVFLAKKDSDFDPSNSSDINSNSIAAQRSTISSQWLETAYPKADMKLYDTLSNAFLDLSSERVDAMVSDKLPALEWLGTTSGSDYALKGEEVDINDNFAIAVRPGDALQAKINQSLANIKANGIYDDINQKYFAVPASSATADTSTDAKIPETPTK